MFVYVRVPPNNPMNERPPSLGPLQAIFTKVSYKL